jgi:hypothetical protein
MKKKLVMGLVIFALLFGAGTGLSAQVRLDLQACPVLGVGVSYNDPDNSSNDISYAGVGYCIPIPEFAISYQFINTGNFRVGIGVRGMSAILESVAWLNAYAEFDIGSITLEAQFGGGGFFSFGIVQGSAWGRVFIPDLSARLNFSDSFGVGVGVTGLYVPDLFQAPSGLIMPFLAYLDIHFVINFGDKNTSDED